MVLADGAGTPLGVHLEQASPSAVKLVEATRHNVRVTTGKRTRGQPKRLIGDRGYDANTVSALLVQRGIAPIMPARRNNRVATHQDGRTLRRYKRRGIIERSNSGLQTFRRRVVRDERSEKLFAAFVHMAWALIT
jgi:DDE family transposase